jgi:hypothetical protein
VYYVPPNWIEVILVVRKLTVYPCRQSSSWTQRGCPIDYKALRVKQTSVAWLAASEVPWAERDVEQN